MRKQQRLEWVVILAHALVGWFLCGAIMWIGMAVTSLEITLIAHALGSPIIFAAVSALYFTRFNYTGPLTTAVLFVVVVVLMDFFLVALVINRSLEMFASPVGTWLPFALIFLATYLTGAIVTQTPDPASAG